VTRGLPVVLLPGLLGTKLGLRGQPGLIWGDLRSFFFPRGGGVFLRDSADVESRGILETVPVIPRVFEVAVYSDLLRHLRVAGRDVHPFGYDFRKDTMGLLADLARHVEEVLRVSGASEVVLVGHSHGGVLASCLARAGGARARIRGVVALAAAFRGSLDNLRMMVDGYQVAPLGFDYGPVFHVLARSPAETLPAPGAPCFEDERGEALDVDLYEVASWMRHELGIFAPAVRQSMGDRAFGLLVRELEAGLQRGADLHRALAAPLPAGTAEHRVIAGSGLPTRRRAVLTRGVSGWRADFRRGQTAPGDGEVELASAAAWRGSEAGPVREVRGTHRDLINNAETCRAVVEELDALERSPAREVVAR